jgi:hypothetical protein
MKEDKKGVAGDTYGTSNKLKGKYNTHSLQAPIKGVCILLVRSSLQGPVLPLHAWLAAYMFKKIFIANFRQMTKCAIIDKTYGSLCKL